MFAPVCAVISPAPFAVLNLVERLEEEETTLVLEDLSNLSPGRLDTLLDIGVRGLVVGSPLDVEPVFIVVQVQDDI